MYEYIGRVLLELSEISRTRSAVSFVGSCIIAAFGELLLFLLQAEVFLMLVG
jgi:hypothetical protein